MAFERTAFLALMPHTVTISTRSSHNNYGEASYGTGVTYRARVVNRSGWVRNMAGEKVEVRTVVWMASTGTIDTSDRITLPDNTTPPIVKVARFPDGDGTHHHQLWLGWTGGGM